MSTLFEPLKNEHRVEDIHNQETISFWGDVWLRLRKNKMAVIGMVMLTLLLIMAIVGPYLRPYTYYQTHLPLKNSPPSSAFWFGTDDLGRDMFTRVWWGARISLFVGIAAAFIDMAIGVLYGALAAYLGGRWEETMMRIADIMHAVPSLLITILLTVVMGPGLLTIILAITLAGWITMARIVRTQMHQIKQMDYVLAARTLGASKWRILLRYLIPNTMGSIIATVTLTIPTAIFTEAFLSFLGLGVQAPVASWGVMASDGVAAMRYYPWRLFFPAVTICVTMLAFNMLGDGLRDALDPRLRK